MIPTKQATRLSKFLSLVLRHRPEEIGLTLDDQGWTDVDDLLEKWDKREPGIDRKMLLYLVEHNSKKRFALSEDGKKIRASQGHSVKINLGYQAQKPPMYLYHGTAQKYIEEILKTGLQKRKRHHVHLSESASTAKSVGQRHGKARVLKVLAQQMQEAGHEFFLSENGVWLTKTVPSEFFILMDQED